MRKSGWIYSISGLAALALFLLPAGATAQTTSDTSDVIHAHDQESARTKLAPEAGRKAAIAEAEAAKTPRMPDGHPDLNGSWIPPQVFCNDAGKCHLAIPNAGYTVFIDDKGVLHAHRIEAGDDAPVAGNSLQTFDLDERRDKNPNKPPYKQEYLAKVANLNLNANQVDPHVLCHPDGPREGPPQQIVQGPNAAAFLYANGENGNYWRIIPTDGRKHRDDLDNSYFGDSVAHWEGDTLVVDTVGYNDDSWLGGDGWFHSTALHLVEHITRKGNLLTYQATFEDPQVWTKPWVKQPNTLLLDTLPDAQIAEVARCVNEDLHHLVNHDHF